MVITAYRQQLLRLAQQAAKAAPVSNLIPEIAGILVEARAEDGCVTMTSTNQETTIKTIGFADVEIGGGFLIDQKIFPAMLAKLPKDEVRIETNNGDHQFHIESGDAMFNYNVLPGSVFPKEEIPCPDGALNVKGIQELTHRTAFAACADSKSQPMLRCINLSFTPKGLYSAASNGQHMIQVAGDRSCQGDFNVMAPAEAMVTLSQLLDKDDELHVQLSGRHVVFWHETLIFSTRTVEGTYLPVDQVFQGVNPAYTVKTRAEDMLRSVQSVMDPEVHQMEIVLRDNEMEFTCNVGTTLEKKMRTKAARAASAVRCFSGTTSLRAIISGSPDKAFYCEPELLCNALKTMTGDIMVGFSQQGHMLIRDTESRYYQTGQKGVHSGSTKIPAAA